MSDPLPTLSAAMRRLAAPPPDDATDADRRTVDLVGLRLPLRASTALVLATLVVLVDYTRILSPDALIALGRSPEALRVVALQRVLLYGLLPLAVVVLVFRDRPARYGLTRGDWRAGLPLLVAGCLLMTPIVLWFAQLPEVRAYYAPSLEPPPSLVLTNTLDLTAAEFLFRGFLTLTLVRAIGPMGVLVGTLPFVFAHLGKPELELFSTLGGGLVYGWLAWRTRSIVWGSIAHVYILSLVILASGS